MNPAASIYSFLSKHSYLLPVGIIGITVGMLLLTLLPADALGENQLWSYDKLGHAVLFGSWSLLLGLYFYFRQDTYINPWTIFSIGAGFGLLIELLQYALPVNRHADPIDFLFDVIGCLIAVWLLKTILPKNITPSAQGETVKQH